MMDSQVYLQNLDFPRSSQFSKNGDSQQVIVCWLVHFDCIHSLPCHMLSLYFWLTWLPTALIQQVPEALISIWIGMLTHNLQEFHFLPMQDLLLLLLPPKVSSCILSSGWWRTEEYGSEIVQAKSGYQAVGVKYLSPKYSCLVLTKVLHVYLYCTI